MAEYDRMIDLVDRAGVVCQIELEMHYNPVVHRVMQLLKDGAIGRIRSFSATNITLSPVWAFPWQGVPELSYGHRVPLAPGNPRFRGGSLCDHPHIFDLIRWLTGADFEYVLAEQAPNMRTDLEVEDLLLVTGDLGASAAGLACLRAGRGLPRAVAPLVKRYLLPAPRLTAGRVLAHSGRVRACLDLSDGLAGDARRLAEASGAGLAIHAERLPVSRQTRLAAERLRRDPLDWALSGGEDYELLFAVRPADAAAVARHLRVLARVPCTVIGEVLPARAGLRLIRQGKTLPMPKGWEHGGA